MQGWLSKAEVGQYIGGKSKRTVERWVAKQILPNGKRFPSGTYWNKEIIDRWLMGTTYERTCDRQLKIRESMP